MWAQYKKTFLRIQILILSVACAILFVTGRLPQASVFFLVMQIGAVLGAMWGVRLQGRLGVTR
jgi:hypothetical protein